MYTNNVIFHNGSRDPLFLSLESSTHKRFIGSIFFTTLELIKLMLLATGSAEVGEAQTLMGRAGTHTWIGFLGTSSVFYEVEIKDWFVHLLNAAVKATCLKCTLDIRFSVDPLFQIISKEISCNVKETLF